MLTINHMSNPEPLVAKAIALLRKNLAVRGGAWSHATFTIGTMDSLPPESYQLQCDGDAAIIRGADAHGVLYGVGRLLRMLEYCDGEVVVPVISETFIPTIADRGVYFATHFNNYYQCAPMAEITAYIEELALWGCNVLTYWFDMNWFPAGFWEEPESAGMQMAKRLRAIGDAAHACGMRVGMTGIANEGFRFQPPPNLRTDISARRGGFYPDSQICPSKPGGLAMILENRRIILDLLSPIDLFFYWPYDQGGCGCAECADEEHRWGQTFLRIGPEITRLVKSNNPEAQIFVSTWFMDEVERTQVYALCDAGAGWFDGIMLQTHLANERQIPARYARWVFPEISMFDCFFTSYGCNGANPAPNRFVAQAREAVAAGCGEAMYSEGIYEDVNKITWLSVLWNPARTAADIMAEYSRYYFGNAKDGADLLLKLENTWGAQKLRETSVATAEALLALTIKLEAGLPADDGCRARWQQLRDRAEMDALMVKIGPDAPLIQQGRLLYEEACTAEGTALRQHVTELQQKLETRQTLIDELFAVHWRYLRSVYTERTTLIFTPDEFLGTRNWAPLAVSLGEAAIISDEMAFREAIIVGFKRWFWFNGIDLDFLFL